MIDFKKYEEIEQVIQELIKFGFHIPRSQMPQIFGDLTSNFLEFLDSEGISHKKVNMPSEKLKVTQGEIDIGKIIPFIKDGLVIRNNKPLLISSDGYILDGHHRFVAIYIIDKYKKIPVVIIDLPIVKLLELTKRFNKVSYKKLKD